MLEDKLDGAKKQEEIEGSYKRGNVIYPKKFHSKKNKESPEPMIELMRDIMGYGILIGSCSYCIYKILEIYFR